MDHSLEDTVTDSVTGFTGTITAKMETLHEPMMYLVENESGHKWLSSDRVVAALEVSA